MKEIYIRLSPEELQRLLQGSLHWSDVASRTVSPKIGIRKLNEATPEQPAISQDQEPDESSKGLEGRPIIWLLGSVGLLTLSSWFYFVLFSK